MQSLQTTKTKAMSNNPFKLRSSPPAGWVAVLPSPSAPFPGRPPEAWQGRYRPALMQAKYAIRVDDAGWRVIKAMPLPGAKRHPLLGREGPLKDFPLILFEAYQAASDLANPPEPPEPGSAEKAMGGNTFTLGKADGTLWDTPAAIALVDSFKNPRP